MARLTYRQIEAFRAVMISGTTSGAADILCISQPAVSRLLSDFEETVAVPMFERQKKRLIPTPEAHVFYAEVERSFVSLEKLKRAADDLRGFHRGTLRVASMPAVSLNLIPGALTAFSTEHPEVSLSYQVRSTQQVTDLVASQQYDIGIVSAIPIMDMSISVEPLSESPLVCALPKGHPLANKSVIRPEDLESESFISLGTDQSMKHKIDSVFDSAGVNRKLNIDTQLFYGACSFVEAGLGVSLVDSLSAMHYSRLGVEVRRFEPEIVYRTSMIFPAHKNRSSVTQSFVRNLRESLSGLREFEASL